MEWIADEYRGFEAIRRLDRQSHKSSSRRAIHPSLDVGFGD
jgi:hypothetical protein